MDCSAWKQLNISKHRPPVRFRALKVTSPVAAPGAVSAVYDCLVNNRGVGTAGATGALAPAMLKPRGACIFSPPQYFPTFLHAVP